MPVFTQPIHELHEFNKCHRPGGSPIGGQFCSDGGSGGAGGPSEAQPSGAPAWWNEPAEGGFNRGMTKGEVILDWLTRNKVEKVGGKYRMYHATPASNTFTELKPGSYLAQEADTATQQAGRDRGLKAGKIRVHEVLFDPWEINPTSVWAITTRPLVLGALVKRKK